ncbi:rpsA, partial [Symbiodinium pilosum]
GWPSLPFTTWVPCLAGAGLPTTGRQRTALHARTKVVEDLNDLTVVELRERLRQLSLPVSGKKRELIERILAAETEERYQDEHQAAEGDEQAAGPAASQYLQMKVAHLKAALRERGLPVSGRKAVLAARLEAADASPPLAKALESEAVDAKVLKPGEVSLESLRVGQKIHGSVRRLSRWGAFVDIGLESTCLMRISRMAERFLNDASEVVSVGQEVDVCIASRQTAKSAFP